MNLYRADQFERGMAMLLYRWAKEKFSGDAVKWLTNDENRFMFDMEMFMNEQEKIRRLEAIKKETMASLTEEQKKALGL